MQQRQYNAISTWVSDRTPRPLNAPMMCFDLAGEAERLRSEDAFGEHGHNARTLIKHSEFRLLLIVLKPGVGIPAQAVDERTCLQVQRGTLTVAISEETITLSPGRLLALDHGQEFGLEAGELTEVLLWLGWSRN